MSVFKRLFKVGEASVNKIVDKMEKPELMLDQAIRDREKSIQEAKAKVMSVIATERQNKALLDCERENQNSWEQRAQTALQSSNEELATRALTRSEEHEQKANGLQPQWESQRKAVEDLKMEIRNMEEELADLKRNKDIIIAQSKAAEVKKEIYAAKAQIGGKSDTGDLIARMKAKAERTAYEADAAAEMAGSSSGGDTLEKDFEKLEGPAASTSVQSKLAEMKAKLENK